MLQIHHRLSILVFLHQNEAIWKARMLAQGKHHNHNQKHHHTTHNHHAQPITTTTQPNHAHTTTNTTTTASHAVHAPAPVSTPRLPRRSRARARFHPRLPRRSRTRTRIDPASTAPFARPHPFSRVSPRRSRARARPKPRIFGCTHPVYFEKRPKKVTV